MQAIGAEPAAAQDQHIGEAVVIVVGLYGVEPADDARQTSLGGALGKGAIALVAEIAQLVPRTPGRGHYIEKAVVVKILHDTAAGQTQRVQAQGGGSIGIAADIVFGVENVGGD